MTASRTRPRILLGRVRDLVDDDDPGERLEELLETQGAPRPLGSELVEPLSLAVLFVMGTLAGATSTA